MPQLKLLLICLLTCLLSNGCKTGPKVTVCVSDPQSNGFQCHNENTNQDFFLAYMDSDKYVAMPPADAQAVFDYCSNAVTKSESK